MKLKTQDLTGPALDWAVAKAEGTLPTHNTVVACRPFEADVREHKHLLCTADDDAHAREQCENAYPGCEIIGVFECTVGKYSSRWEMAGPIIEREGVNLNFMQFDSPQYWTAHIRHTDKVKFGALGPTPLIAAMRCFVASKLGDTIDIPEELL